MLAYIKINKSGSFARIVQGYWHLAFLGQKTPLQFNIFLYKEECKNI